MIFVPATPGSQLKTLLQNQDNLITQAMNYLQVRFVERAGMTVMEELGRNNPWASEWYCPGKDCLLCQGRAFLAAEEVEEAIQMVARGENPVKKVKKEDRKSLPSCIVKGMNYILSVSPVETRREGEPI